MNEWAVIAEWDWVVVGGGKVLHAVADLESADPDDWGGQGVTACGRGGYLWIPGPLSRMNVVRCVRCCAKTGMPTGVGSPKNDDRCRPVVESRLPA